MKLIAPFTSISALIACFVLTTSFASGTVVNKRDDALAVAISGPGKVDTVNDLVFKVSVTNNGTNPLRLLKYNSLLDVDYPIYGFNVTKEAANGTVEVPFVGVAFSVSLDETDDTAYVSLKPKDSLTVLQNVSASYDFAATGPGTYQFAPVSFFTVNNTGSQETYLLEFTTPVLSVVIEGDLQRRDGILEDNLAKRETISCSNAVQKAFLQSSYDEAVKLAKLGFMQVTTYNIVSPYSRYWGNEHWNPIIATLRPISLDSYPGQLSCVDTFSLCRLGVLSYTLGSAPFSTIYFCPTFFAYHPSKNLCGITTPEVLKVRGGKVLHQLTRYYGHTEAYVSTCSSARSLNDHVAVFDATSYECFALEVYSSLAC